MRKSKTVENICCQTSVNRFTILDVQRHDQELGLQGHDRQAYQACWLYLGRKQFVFIDFALQYSKFCMIFCLWLFYHI